jgi:diaminohydroxyphosphoribosylaminopyrimidine deaminase/5-amino-6-(5-phosphoribosylamino)uracil reductase
VLADDPLLNCRLPGMAARSPVRIVLDGALRIPGDSRLVRSARETPLWIIASEFAEAAAAARLDAAAARLGAAGAEVIRLAPAGAPGLDPLAVLHTLSERGITRVLVEGGSRVASSFVAAGLADEIWLLRGPDAIGADGIAALDALPLAAITQSPAFRVRASEMLDQDSLTVYERV